jgi:5'-nucleotidase
MDVRSDSARSDRPSKRPLLTEDSERGPQILVTNDDGVDSPGLHALALALAAHGDVVIIAPDRNRTGAARSITMRAPLWVEEVGLPGGLRGYATDGTPVDCVRLAALGLLDSPPDLIFSGINLSGNLGDDITYSGTVAAAFEGIMLDIPAVAVSAEGYHEGYDLRVPAAFAAHLAALILRHGFPTKTLLNVNCPDLSWEGLQGARLTSLGKRIYGDEVQLQETAGPRRRYFIYGDDLSYHQEQGTDFDAIADGFISITPLHFELTARDALPFLQSWELDPRPAPTRPPQATAVAGPGVIAVAPAGPAPELGEESHAASASRRPLAPPPATVVFDLDGTVVDSVELIVVSFEHAARTVLGREIDRPTLIRHVGRPLREQMAFIDPERADELVTAYREHNHRIHDSMLRLFPGMAELLLRLRARGVKLGLVTSKSRHTAEMAFRLTGIDLLLQASVCADETTKHKPEPEPLFHCLELLDGDVATALYVGDAPADIQAARAAGMRSVAVTWGVFPEADLLAEEPCELVRSMSELADLLGV